MIEITGLYLSYISNIYDYLEKRYFTNFDVKIENPILYYLYCYKSQADDYNNLAGKTICVDFVETENGIDLYRKYGKLVYTC